MAQLITEKDQIETVGQLRAVLADLPDDMSVSDQIGQALYVAVWQAEGEKILPDGQFVQIS